MGVDFSDKNSPATLQKIGCVLIAAMTAAIGIISIFTGDFAYTWMPVPEEMPLRAIAARLVGAVLVAPSTLLVMQRTFRQGIVAMLIVFALWLMLHLPGLLSGASWLGFFEFLLPIGAMLALMRVLSLNNQRWVLIGRALFGVGLIGCGTSHFVYADFAAQMIPEWIPGRLFWTYLTGVGHIAAGLSLLSGVLLRISTALLCFMIACFVLFLHLPRVIATPTSRFEWTMMFVALLFNGAAVVIASVVRNADATDPIADSSSPKASVAA